MKDIAEYLREDHRKVKKLFREFESATEGQEKQDVVRRIRKKLTLHAALEEELVYPIVSRELDGGAQEALEEHHVMKLLIDDLRPMMLGEEHFAAKVTVLAQVVERHVEEEESELLPRLVSDEEATRQFLVRKRELTLGLEDGAEITSTRPGDVPRDVEGARWSPARDRGTGALRNRLGLAGSDRTYPSVHP